MVLVVYWMSNRGVMYSCRSFLLLVSMTRVIAFVHDYCSIFQTLLPTPVNVFIVLVFSRRVLHQQSHPNSRPKLTRCLSRLRLLPFTQDLSRTKQVYQRQCYDSHIVIHLIVSGLHGRHIKLYLYDRVRSTTRLRCQHNRLHFPMDVTCLLNAYANDSISNFPPQ